MLTVLLLPWLKAALDSLILNPSSHIPTLIPLDSSQSLYLGFLPLLSLSLLTPSNRYQFRIFLFSFGPIAFSFSLFFLFKVLQF